MENTVELDYVELGRAGYAYGNGTAKLELAGSRCNPRLFVITGLNKSGDVIMRRIDEDRRSVSGGGNGHAYYSGLKDGLYYADGLLGTSNRIYKHYYTLEDGELYYLDNTEIMDYMREHFVGDYATYKAEQDRIKKAAEQAKALVEEILAKRTSFDLVVIKGIEARPEFLDFTNQDIKHALLGGSDAYGLIQKYGIPTDYVVNAPIFVKALTAEEAIEKALIAKKIADEIMDERETFTTVEIDGIKAQPDFEEFTAQDIIRGLSRGSSEDEIIQTYYAPKHYIVNLPFFAKASTAEEAIRKAREKDKQRKAEKQAARKAAKESGLPKLTGTTKQKAWALTLRDKFAQWHPNDPRLKTETTAKFWIEHRGMC